MEGIVKGMHGKKDLKGDAHLVRHPGKDSSVEGISQSMHAMKDMKGEPPDRHVEVLI